MPDQHGVEMGGTMRLGLWPCRLEPGSIAANGLRRAEWSSSVIATGSRSTTPIGRSCEAAGLVVSGVSPDGNLVEIMELKDHPFFVGVQFHPEFRSRPTRPHPLFRDFVGRRQSLLPEGAQRALPLNGAVITTQYPVEELVSAAVD